MFEFAKKLPGIDLSIALLPWIVAVLASALALVFACVEMRGMRRMSAISIVIVCVIAATAVWVRDQLGARDVAAERRALDERAFALKLQGLMPGSALACLEALGSRHSGRLRESLIRQPRNRSRRCGLCCRSA